MNKSKSEKPTAVTNFSEIKSSQELISYLSDATNRLENHDRNVYHYTSLDKAISILKSGYWLLKTPEAMNDGLEFQNISEADQRNQIYFASFMYNTNESIAMWSMYAQPWENGIYIGIPVAEFKKWIRNTKICNSAWLPEKDLVQIDKQSKYKLDLSIARVAYSNSDSVDNELDEVLTCGNAENKILKKTPHMPDLVGYIKDTAWDYEQEVRVLTSFDQSALIMSPDALAIPLTEDIINSMKMVAGPRFNGNLPEIIWKETNRQIKTDYSLFTKKLNWIPCDSCRIKKEFEKQKEAKKQESYSYV